MNEYEKFLTEIKTFESKCGFKAPKWAYERLEQLKEGESDE